MKLYILYHNSYEGDTILGIFSTLEKANEEKIRRENPTDLYNDRLFIDEYELDEINS